MEQFQGGIVLVGFQDQDNLGLRYLAAAAHRAGFPAKLVSYSDDPSVLLKQVRGSRPLAVGFSLIFQYMAPRFGELIQSLRDAGVQAHFTMGGHYASFDYAQILQCIPGLDSVVRFEGEQTLCELLQCLRRREDWRDLAGIAYRDDDGIRANPLRPPQDLDGLPEPYRDDIRYSGPLPTASILASRGCPWNCSFCSIRPFYEAQGGPLRRLRDPDSVVAEMAELYRERGVRIFLFQDDDFLATGRRARRWAENIAQGISCNGMAGNIAFKISCRSDEIRADIMAKLVRAGLTHVYLGVESGDEQGLRNLNKFIDPETHLRAGQVLKEQGISFDFGFMLLEPDSNFDGIRNNIQFLRRFVGDGASTAGFCRMLPYAGSSIKQRLEQQGRLLGTPFQPDYKFTDSRLDLFYDWMLATFRHRNFSADGLVSVLRGLSFEANLRYGREYQADRFSRAYVRHLIAVCNGIAMNTLEAAVDWFERADPQTIRIDDPELRALTEREWREEQRLLEMVSRFVRGVDGRLAA